MISYYDSDPSRDYSQDKEFYERFDMPMTQEERLIQLEEEESRKEQEISELWYRLLGCCVPDEEGE